MLPEDDDLIDAERAASMLAGLSMLDVLRLQQQRERLTPSARTVIEAYTEEKLGGALARLAREGTEQDMAAIAQYSQEQIERLRGAAGVAALHLSGGGTLAIRGALAEFAEDVLRQPLSEVRHQYRQASDYAHATDAVSVSLTSGADITAAVEITAVAGVVEAVSNDPAAEVVEKLGVGPRLRSKNINQLTFLRDVGGVLALLRSIAGIGHTLSPQQQEQLVGWAIVIVLLFYVGQAKSD